MTSTRDVVKWQDEGLCQAVDPEVFFPVGETTNAVAQIREAKNICQACPVKYDCLLWALQGRELGIWGGTHDTDRQAMKRHLAHVPYSNPSTLAYALGVEMPECTDCGDHVRVSKTGYCANCRTEPAAPEREVPPPVAPLPPGTPVCVEDGCGREVLRQGLCSRDYQRTKRAADPERYRARERAQRERSKARKAAETAPVTVTADEPETVVA